MQNYNQFNFYEVNPHELMNYLVSKHHSFAKAMLELVMQHSLMLANEGQTQAQRIYETLIKLNNFARSHFQDEEEILFPYAKKLIEWEREANNASAPVINIIGNPICRFIKEHEVLIIFFEQIRRITDNYSGLLTKKSPLMLLHYELFELDQDIQKQVFIEDHILFNKLLGLQKDLIIDKLKKS